MSDDYKHPRLYVDAVLGETITLSAGQSHYLKNVLRKGPGDHIRAFNGKDGEWLADIVSLEKKEGSANCTKQLRAQPAAATPRHLLFPPLVKDRLDFLIEKSVELGATHLHPITTERREIRKINEERLSAQIIEAAEQCERMDIPALAPLTELKAKLAEWDKSVPLYAALERMDAAPLPREMDFSTAFLIGPPGGFSDDEKMMLSAKDFIQPVTLGDTILRTETAALYMLGAAR